MSNTKPNLVFIHCHDLGQHLGCYGVPTVVSPHLDALAARGTRFANHFCTSPSCSPSRAAIFTGRYPTSNGVLGLCHAQFGWELNDDEIHLAQYLKGAGYRTATVGVLHESRAGSTRCGYDLKRPGGCAIGTTNNALAVLQEYQGTPGQPFLLTVGYFEPHRIVAPGSTTGDQGFVSGESGPDTSLGVTIPPYLRDTEGTRTEIAELQGAIRHLDAQVGRLLAAIQGDNTLVVFTTDHGIAMPRAKCSLYDPGLRTTLIVRGPGLPVGRVCEDLVSNIDLLPTLLETLGVAVPARVEGRSLRPLLAPAAPAPGGGAVAHRDAIFGEMTYHDYYDPRRCIRTATHKLIANFTTAPTFMDPSQSWRPRSDTVKPFNRATAYHEDIELYDLRVDPWEWTNLADLPEHAAVRQELVARLLAHLQETGDKILQGAIAGPQQRRVLGSFGDAG